MLDEQQLETMSVVCVCELRAQQEVSICTEKETEHTHPLIFTLTAGDARASAYIRLYGNTEHQNATFEDTAWWLQ